MIKVEHIGIAIKNIEEVNALYTKIFNQKPYKQEHVDSESVDTTFFQVGQTKIEFLASENPESTIGKYVKKNGSGIHHIAFEVDDIQSEINRLEAEGFNMIYNPARIGADNKLVTFIHPKGTDGILIELCQETHDFK
ncbi:MAG: methylmalonyl-CoA epimerase [Flammeovirgaceae bacterium]|nr:methylmalonyl-CoA epimerase [Flammeovirgaceae bacterium]